jgi:hypothetical protein
LFEPSNPLLLLLQNGCDLKQTDRRQGQPDSEDHCDPDPGANAYADGNKVA